MKNIKKEYVILGILFICIVCLLVFKFINDERKRNSVSVWDPETTSFNKYKSYKEYEIFSKNEEGRKSQEYFNAIKNTIVEKVQNAETPSYDEPERLFNLENGEIKEEIPAERSETNKSIFLWSASLVRDINAFTVGDFNKDGLEDVAHVIGYKGGGSGYFYYLNIYTNKGNELKYITQEYLGDRIIIKGLKYNSGLFIFDMITQGEGDDFMGYCCANVKKTLEFKLENNKLIETKD